MTTYNSAYNETYPISDTCAQLNLATSAALTYTVPGTNDKRYRASFSTTSTANVWVGYNITPVAPTSGTATTANNQEFVSSAGYNRYVRGGDVIKLITSDTAGAQVGISLLSLPSQ